MSLIKKEIQITTYETVEVPGNAAWYRFFNGIRWTPVEVYDLGGLSYFRVGSTTAVPVHKLEKDCFWGGEILMPRVDKKPTIGDRIKEEMAKSRPTVSAPVQEESEEYLKKRLAKNYPNYKPDLTEPHREPLRVDGGEPHMIVDAEILEEVVDNLSLADLIRLDEGEERTVEERQVDGVDLDVEWDRKPTPKDNPLTYNDPVEWEVGGTVLDTGNPHDWPDMRKEAHARQGFHCPREMSQCRGPEKPIFNDKFRLLSWYTYNVAN